MTPLKQTIFGDKRGNCFQAAIASILDLQLEEVPHFCAGGNEQWWRDCVAWADSRGFNAVCFEPWEGHFEFLQPIDDYYIVTGKSPRGDFYHCVVGHKGLVVHDPHPDNTFIIEPTVDLTFIVPKSRSGFHEDGRFWSKNE